MSAGRDHSGRGISCKAEVEAGPIMPTAMRRVPMCSRHISLMRGIIQISALCVLCRYRHNIHWTAAEDRVGRDLSRYAKDRTDRAREDTWPSLAAASCALISASPRSSSHGRIMRPTCSLGCQCFPTIGGRSSRRQRMRSARWRTCIPCSRRPKTSNGRREPALPCLIRCGRHHR